MRIYTVLIHTHDNGIPKFPGVNLYLSEETLSVGLKTMFSKFEIPIVLLPLFLKKKIMPISLFGNNNDFLSLQEIESEAEISLNGEEGIGSPNLDDFRNYYEDYIQNGGGSEEERTKHEITVSYKFVRAIGFNIPRRGTIEDLFDDLPEEKDEKVKETWRENWVCLLENTFRGIVKNDVDIYPTLGYFKFESTEKNFEKLKGFHDVEILGYKFVIQFRTIEIY